MLEMTLGERIRLQRQVLNVTQQGLAKAAGVTSQHISGIEQDRFAPSVAILPKLAEELGVTTDYLLSGKESVVTDTIPALKADKNLTLAAKTLLIGLVEQLRRLSAIEED